MPTSYLGKSKKRRYPGMIVTPGLSDDPCQAANSNKSTASDKTANTLRTTLDLVLEASQLHNAPSAGGRIDRQPWAKFEDTVNYNVTEDQEAALWKIEFERLLRDFQNETLLPFEGHDILDQQEAQYKGLSDVADQILCNMAVMRCDAEILTMEFMYDYFSSRNYRKARRILEERLSSDEPKMNPRRLKAQNKQVYYALVDYVTTVVARLLIRCITIDSFHTNCIMILGEISTKLKVLYADPVRHAETSLELAEETRRRLEMTSTIRNAQYLWQDHGGEAEGIEGEKDIGGFRGNSSGRIEPEEDVNRRIYHMNNMTLRALIMDIINFVMVQLHGARKWMAGTSKDTVVDFNMTSLVYEAGFSSHPTLVSQDRFGEFAAASAPEILRPCYTAFKMLVETSLHLEDHESKTASIALVDWTWEDLDNLPERKLARTKQRVSKMDHVVTMMVPLICTEAPLCAMVSFLTNMSNVMVNEPTIDVSEFKYVAFFNLKTPTSDKRSGNVLDSTLPLADCSLIRSRRYAEDELARKKTQSKRNSVWKFGRQKVNQGTQYERDSRQNLLSLDAEINRGWVIDDDSITIRCEAYVLTVLALCFILVSGGFAVGLTVGERIRGVDPFGITTFCWTLAALVLLVSKSVYVENWPWRDFLLRRCVCRSVSELASITGIEAQNVIIYLLHNEDDHILSVRGPYNKAFAAPETWGFSIDVKPTLRTLQRSGIIMIMVATDNGPALVGLNARKKKWLVEIDHYHRDHDDDTTLACIDGPQTNQANTSTAGLKLQRLGMTWHRAYGVYDSARSEFR